MNHINFVMECLDCFSDSLNHYCLVILSETQCGEVAKKINPHKVRNYTLLRHTERSEVSKSHESNKNNESMSQK